MHVTRWTPMLCLVLLAACASGGTNTSDDTAPTTRRGRRNVISADDLRGLVVQNAYEAVQRLRPAWLRARGRTGTPVIYRDDLRVSEELSGLQQMSVDNIQEIRFIRASDATTRWGTGHQAGVIQVVTRR